MALEDLTGSLKFISDLVASNPVGSTDFIDDADDHLRGIKNVLKNSFPNINGAMTATDEELDALAGAGISATEMAYLATITSNVQDQLDAITDVGQTSNGNYLDNIALSFGTGLDAAFSFDGSRLELDLLNEVDFYLLDNEAGETRFFFDISVGDFHADGNIIGYSTSVGSDPRLKKHIQPMADAVRKLKYLKGVTFEWKKNGQLSAGLLSTDVAKALPEAVSVQESLNDGPFEAVNYNAIIGLLVEVIKVVETRVGVLEMRVTDKA